jgi:hypothetical protein
MVTTPGKVSRAFGSASLGMAAPRAHLEGITGTIRPLVAITGDRHLAFENEKAGIELMSVLGIDRVRLHVAIDQFCVTLLAQLDLEICPTHLHLPDDGAQPTMEGRCG